MTTKTVSLLLMLVVVAVIVLRSRVNTNVSAAEEQAVIVKLKLRSDSEVQQIHELEDKLISAIKKASAGEFDGDEFGEGTCTLYMYGPSAERLFDATIQTLREYPAAKGSYLLKRFGKPGAKQDRVELGR
jgi:hypothetical protein